MGYNDMPDLVEDKNIFLMLIRGEKVSHAILKASFFQIYTYICLVFLI